MKKIAAVLLIAGSLFFGMFELPLSRAAAAARPNIVFIMADDNDELQSGIAQKDAKTASIRVSNPHFQTTKNHGKSREIQGN